MDKIFASPRQKKINAVLLALISYFFVAQAWDQSSTTNAVIGIWVLGLASLFLLQRPKLSNQEFLLMGSAVIVFVVALLSYLASPFENLPFKHLEPYTRFLFFPLVLLAARICQLSLNQLRFALILGGLSYGIAFLNHTITGHGRMHGDENPVTFGNGAGLIAVCLLFSLTIKTEHPLVWKIATLAAFCGATLASIASGTRGTFLAIPLLIIMALVISHNKKIIVIASIAILVVATLFVTLSNQNLGERIVKTKAEISAFFNGNANSPSGLRLAMWKSSVCLFKENPIIGSGPNTFRNASTHYEECSIKVNEKPYSAWQAHSLYFNTAATLGALGFISILLFFSILIICSSGENRIMLLAATTILLSSGITVELFFKTFTADKYLTILAILIGTLKTRMKQ